MPQKSAFFSLEGVHSEVLVEDAKWELGLREVIEVLSPRKEIVTSVDQCHNTEVYYLNIYWPRFKWIYGNITGTDRYMEEKYSLEIVSNQSTKSTKVELYKVESLS